MKKTFILVPAIACFILIACNNTDQKQNKPIVKTQEDSLLEMIDKNHEAAMGKENKLDIVQKQVKELIDSIEKMPAKAQSKLAPVRARLEAVMSDLKSAKDRMDNWMDNFNIDSAKDDMKARIHYLLSEKSKVAEVTDGLIDGLKKADSALKAKLQ